MDRPSGFRHVCHVFARHCRRHRHGIYAQEDIASGSLLPIPTRTSTFQSAIRQNGGIASFGAGWIFCKTSRNVDSVGHGSGLGCRHVSSI